jgi:hypothetical protein
MLQSFLNPSVLARAHLSPPKEWELLFLGLVLVPTIQVLQLPANQIKTALAYSDQFIS